MHHYLCISFCVGTDNYVKRIRLINTIRDTVKSNEHITAIPSGSFGKGLEMRVSYRCNACRTFVQGLCRHKTTFYLSRI